MIASAPIRATKASSPNFVAQLAVALLGDELPLLELRLAGIDDDVALEVEDALEVAQR